MATLRGAKAKFAAHPQYDVPRHIYDIDSRSSRRSARTIVDGFIKKIAKDLKIKRNLSQLKFDKVKKTIFGSQVLWQQYYEGSPISGAWIKVDVSKDGKVFNVVNELVPVKAIAAARKKTARKASLLSDDDAKAKALELARETKGATAKILGSELVYFPYDGIPTAAWKDLVQITSPRSTKDKSQEWKLYLDALAARCSPRSIC